jgi:hypothetical protein
MRRNGHPYRVKARILRPMIQARSGLAIVGLSDHGKQRRFYVHRLAKAAGWPMPRWCERWRPDYPRTMTESGPEQTIAPAGIPSAEAFGTVSAQSRHVIALQHRWNARRAARLCSEAEATMDRNNFYAVRGQSMNAVISAAAYIETLVNEVFANVAD